MPPVVNEVAPPPLAAALTPEPPVAPLPPEPPSTLPLPSLRQAPEPAQAPPTAPLLTPEPRTLTAPVSLPASPPAATAAPSLPTPVKTKRTRKLRDTPAVPMGGDPDNPPPKKARSAPSLETEYPVGGEAVVWPEGIETRGTVLAWQRNPQGQRVPLFQPTHAKDPDSGEWYALPDTAPPFVYNTVASRGAKQSMSRYEPLSDTAPTDGPAAAPLDAPLPDTGGRVLTTNVFTKSQGWNTRPVGPEDPITGDQAYQVTDRDGNIIARGNPETIRNALSTRYGVTLGVNLGNINIPLGRLWSFVKRTPAQHIRSAEEALDMIGTRERVGVKLSADIRRVIDSAFTQHVDDTGAPLPQRITLRGFAGRDDYTMGRKELWVHARENAELRPLLTAGEQRAMSMVDTVFGDLAQLAKSRGFLDGLLDDYIMHLYGPDAPATVRAKLRSVLWRTHERTGTGFGSRRRERKYATYEDAIAAGKDTAILDPGLLVEAYVRSYHRRAAVQDAFDAFTRIASPDGTPLIMPAEHAPNTPAYQQSVKLPSGMEGSYRIWGDPDAFDSTYAKRLLERFTRSTEDISVPVYDAVSSFTKGLSTLNPADNFAWAWGKAFGQALQHPIATGRLLASDSNPFRVNDLLLDDFIAHGGNHAKLKAFQHEVTEPLQGLEQSANPWVNKPVRMLQAVQDFSFGTLVGRAQLFSYQLLKTKFRSQGWSDRDAGQLAARKANMIHETMAAEWSGPMARFMGRTLLFSRERARSLVSIAASTIGHGKGTRGLSDAKQAALAREMAGYIPFAIGSMYLFNATVQKMVYGTWPWENDPNHPLDIQYASGDETSDGRAHYFVSPFGKHGRDMASFITDPGTKLLYNRMHAFLKPIMGMVTDQMAGETKGEALGRHATEVARTFLPIGTAEVLAPPFDPTITERVLPVTGGNIRRGARGGEIGEHLNAFDARTAFESRQRSARIHQLLDTGRIADARTEYFNRIKYPTMGRPSQKGWQRLLARRTSPRARLKSMGPTRRSAFSRYLDEQRGTEE